jgi:PAS domain S-box-containing protein
MDKKPPWKELEQVVTGLKKESIKVKRAEAPLSLEKKPLESLIEHSALAMVTVNEQHNITSCNRGFEKLFQFEAYDILGKNLDETIAGEEFIEHARSYTNETFKGKAVHGYGKRHRKDGTYLDVEFFGVPVIIDEKVTGALGVYQDISERKRMEDALRESEERYRDLYANAPNAYFSISAVDGSILNCNAAAERLLGYSKDSMLKMKAFDLYDDGPYGISKAKKVFKRFKVDGSIRDDELQMKHKDGRPIWISLSVEPVRDHDGEIIASRSMAVDISERKKAEEALKKSSEKIKLFAYSVSHDLKSPAIGIYGLTKRLHKKYRDLLDEKGRDYCDQILKASEQITALVEQINAYISTKETPLRVERVKLKEILEVIRKEFSAQLNICQIKWFQPEIMPEIKVDRLSLLRLLRNLVDNALKYGGNDLSEISIGYKESAQFHILSISDDGVGIKDGDSEKIFGTFQRHETSKGVEGTGLGLSIVKEVAEKHGGRVWMEPGPEKLTTFFISFSKHL